MSSTVTPPPRPRAGSFESGSRCGFFKNNYTFMFSLCLVLIVVESALWRRFFAPFCGDFCNINLLKEQGYFKIAEMFTFTGFDYSVLPSLQYPAGIVYFYKGLSLIPEASWLRAVIPSGIFFYFLFLVAYLMRRCRIPATFMLFFVFPVGALLQGHALKCVLPEILGLAGLLQTLAALLSGYPKLAVFSLAFGLSFDFVTVGPLLPALSLGLMRTMGARWSIIWILTVLAAFTAISVPFLAQNWTAYLSQSLHLSSTNSSWNPLVWLAHWTEMNWNLGLLSQGFLEQLAGSVTWSLLVHSAAQIGLANFRWLRVDGGIMGLLAKFHNSSRGYGIRPNPWTPRQTLTVIFEAMLVMGLLRFPSLIHVEDFGVLSVLLSGFFCVALADPIPMPALFGVFTALAFPLTFLYRKFEESTSVSNVHFYPQIHATLHFLPMLLLPVAQLAILVLLKRRDVPSFIQKTSTSPTTSSNNLNSAVNKSLASSSTFSNHHRRSNSLSRRSKTD